MVNNWHPCKVERSNCPHFTEEEIVFHSGKAHLCSLCLCCVPRYFPGVLWGPITNYLEELSGPDGILWDVTMQQCNNDDTFFVFSVPIGRRPGTFGHLINALWTEQGKEREDCENKDSGERALHLEVKKLSAEKRIICDCPIKMIK